MALGAQQNQNTAADEILKREMCAILAHYGQPLRDMFLWYWWYEINTAEDANKLVVNPSNPDTLKNTLEDMGNMQILEVWSGKINPGKFNAALDLFLNADEKKELNAISTKMGYDNLNPNYYWFVAKVNEKMLESQFDADQKLAENFIGKYWYKYYNTPIPGASNTRTQMQAASPDGTPEWYISSKEVTSLGIFDFGHDPNSTVGRLAENFVKDTSQNENGYNKSAGGDDKQKRRAVTSFVLLERDAKMYPTKDKVKDYDQLFKFYKDYTPQLVGTAGRPDNLMVPSLYPAASKDTSIVLFFARQYSDFRMSFDIVPNIMDAYYPTMKKEVHEDQFGNEITNNIGNYGLLSNNCVRITVGSAASDGTSKQDIVIYTPSQSLSNYAEINSSSSSTSQNYGDITVGQDGYRVYLEASAKFTKVLPKIQHSFGIDADKADIAAHVDYHFKEIQEDNLKVLQKDNACIPSKQAIADYINNIAVNSAYSQVTPQKTVSFKLPGICPQIWGVDQGLNSMQITISEGGAYTSYSFEDKVIMPPSDDYLQQYLIDKATNASSPTVGQNSFTTQQSQLVSAALG